LEDGAVKSFSVECLGTGLTDAIQVTFSGANGWTNFAGHASATLDVHRKSSLLLHSMGEGWSVTSSNKAFQVRDVNGTSPQFSIGLTAVTGL